MNNQTVVKLLTMGRSPRGHQNRNDGSRMYIFQAALSFKAGFLFHLVLVGLKMAQPGTR